MLCVHMDITENVHAFKCNGENAFMRECVYITNSMFKYPCT